MVDCKKALAIVSVYDADGIIDGYIIFFLLSLKSVTSRIIVVVNGKLTKEGENKLKAVIDDIYIRNNTGFDFGAYKDVVENYLSREEILCYQELILCNDTCFGPLVSFDEIFSKMNNKDLKIWSMNYIDDILLPHFQSYFMVFREEGIELVLNFLHKEVDSKTTDMAQAHGHEHALSEVILMSNIRTDYYTSKSQGSHDIDIFGAPDYAIKCLDFPLLKKKVLSEDYCRRENCLEALRLIAEKGEYPISYIWENAERKCHINLKDEINNVYLTEKRTFEKNSIERETIIEFCRRHKKIYIYGNGYMSVLFLSRFRRYINEFGGYIVSDEYYKESMYKGECIYPLSYMEPDIPVIVTLMKEASMQVMDKMKDRENVLFLSIKPKES